MWLLVIRDNKRIQAFKWYCQRLHSHHWHVYLTHFALLRDVIERVHPGTIGKSNLGESTIFTRIDKNNLSHDVIFESRNR